MSTREEELQGRLKMEAFHLACRTIFLDYDEEDSKDMFTYMARTDNPPLPSGLETSDLYDQFVKAGTLKNVIASTTQSLYTIMVTGASLVIEVGRASSIPLEDLEEALTKL